MINYLDVLTENFSPQFEIGSLNKEVIETLLNQIDEKTLIINTSCLWPVKNNFELVINKIQNLSPTKIFLWTDIDWDRHNQGDQLIDMLENEFNAVWAGNYPGDYFFCYWLEFIRKHKDEYGFNDFTPDVAQSKLYMTLNRKPHAHRVEFVEEVYKQNLNHQGWITLGETNPEDPPNTKLPVPIVLPNEKNLLDLEKVKRGNRQVINDVGLPNDILSLGTEHYWNRHFINITVETTNWSSGFLSEKTFKPILGYRPFIILGDKNVYKILHSFGIDTFDDLFGDWYTESCFIERIKRVTEILEKYAKLSNEELIQVFYYNIKDRLENNRKQLFVAAHDNHIKLQTLLSNNK